ncbi:hypothetical protein LOK49_LG02G03162 [Camellia lanceoleosa]|uniref:Uncharacterized protein n=1 Tax=Camellia lanceoleosa TaxID=1840588 RepID=A0ACC0IJX2_9ERIC|nr:hypothetical protein LOK49_LG02G03162 [Camellia lanceoleosa]
MEFGSSKGGVVAAEESSRGARGVGLESSRPVLGLESSRHGVLREWGFSSMEFFSLGFSGRGGSRCCSSLELGVWAGVFPAGC